MAPGRSRKTCQHAYMTAMRIFTVPNLGRGHCLFASLADQVYGTPDKHPEMRRDIVDYVKQHQENFFDWIDVNEELECGTGKRSTRKKKAKDEAGNEVKEEENIMDHITALNNRLDRMAGREWGDQIEIAAFCQAFDYDVVLFSPDGLRVLENPKHDAKLERRRIHIAYGGEERYPHYESIRKFGHDQNEVDTPTTDSLSRESSQATETSGEKSIEEINTKILDKLNHPTDDLTAYTPRDVKLIDIFDLSKSVLTRRDIKELIEDAASRANITLPELIQRDRARSRSSRSSSHDTTSSGKRTRPADDDDEDESPARKIGGAKGGRGTRRSARIKKKINIKLRLGPDPNASPPSSQEGGIIKLHDTTPDHRSPLSQSQSTDDVNVGAILPPPTSNSTAAASITSTPAPLAATNQPPTNTNEPPPSITKSASTTTKATSPTTTKAPPIPPPRPVSPKPTHDAAKSPLTVDARA